MQEQLTIQKSINVVYHINRIKAGVGERAREPTGYCAEGEGWLNMTRLSIFKRSYNSALPSLSESLVS